MERQKRSVVETATGGNTPKRHKTSTTANDAGRYWANKLVENIELATKEQVANLAKDLFEAFWKTSDGRSATAATEPFRETIESIKKKNSKANGEWAFGKGGLTIYRGINDARFEHDDIEPCTLKLTSSMIANPLVYEGETTRYRSCYDGFNVTLKLMYEKEIDTIKCYLSVSPDHETDCGHPDIYGGGDDFVAIRYENFKVYGKWDFETGSIEIPSGSCAFLKYEDFKECKMQLASSILAKRLIYEGESMKYGVKGKLTLLVMHHLDTDEIKCNLRFSPDQKIDRFIAIRDKSY